MPIRNISEQLVGTVGVNPGVALIQTDDTQSTILNTGYLNQCVQNGASFSLPCVAAVSTQSGPGVQQDSGWYQVQSYGGNWSLTPIMSPNSLIWYDVTCTASALASSGKVVVQLSTAFQQYKIRNVIVNYSAAGLSGGSGNRLLALTDGTNAFNSTGITSALLGTPVNTPWGGTGNPLAGTLAQNTSTVAGANLYLQYAGGTTDYSTGSVSVSILVQRVN